MALHAILSDVHGNLPALLAVVQALDASGVHDVFCLGDLVGYCADPNACVAIARARDFRCIAGNHELVATGELGFERCGLAPAHALRRTRQRLDRSTRVFLSDLPMSLEHDGRWLFVHGSVTDACEYMVDEAHIAANHRILRERHPEARVCFFGHTHVGKVYEVRGGDVVAREGEGSVTLSAGSTWFVNPGAVDGSRAPERCARFAVVNDETGEVTFRRAAYDHGEVERKARKEGYRLGRARIARRALSRWVRARTIGMD